MRIEKLALSFTFSLMLILAAGCSDNGTGAQVPDKGAATDSGTGTDKGAPPADLTVIADRGKTFNFSLRFRDQLTANYLTGVKVCIKDTTTCVTTQGTGVTAVANVVLPTDQDSILLATLSGYMNAAYFVGKDNTEPSMADYLMPTSLESQIATKAGVTLDQTKAMMRLYTVDALMGGYGNASLELSPKAGDGPMAADKDGFPDPKNPKTGALGLAYAWIFNVPAGDYTLKAKDNDGNVCEVLIGWKNATNDAARMKLVAGHINSTNFICRKQKL